MDATEFTVIGKERLAKLETAETELILLRQAIGAWLDDIYTAQQRARVELCRHLDYVQTCRNEFMAKMRPDVPSHA